MKGWWDGGVGLGCDGMGLGTAGWGEACWGWLVGDGRLGGGMLWDGWFGMAGKILGKMGEMVVGSGKITIFASPNRKFLQEIGLGVSAGSRYVF